MPAKNLGPLHTPTVVKWLTVGNWRVFVGRGFASGLRRGRCRVDRWMMMISVLKFMFRSIVSFFVLLPSLGQINNNNKNKHIIMITRSSVISLAEAYNVRQGGEWEPQPLLPYIPVVFCCVCPVSTLGGGGVVYSMNEWMAWIIHGQRRDWMRKLWSANPSSSSETDLCRNYQIMSTLMIVIITCVAGHPSIRRTFIEFCVRCQEEYVAWSSSATDGAKQPKNDHKLSTPFPESIKWWWSLSIYATFLNNTLCGYISLMLLALRPKDNEGTDWTKWNSPPITLSWAKASSSAKRSTKMRNPVIY